MSGQVIGYFGAGVEGVSVQVETGGDETTEGNVLGRAVSDGMGDFRIPLASVPSATLHIRARKAGFVDYYGEVEFEDGDPEAYVALELEGAQVVSGQVLQASTDVPVVGAFVAIDEPEGRWHTRTGEDGRFELGNVPAGQWVLLTTAEGYARQRMPLQIDADTAGILVRMEAERPIRIVVVDESRQSVPAAQVEIQLPREFFTATTDAEGRADIHGIGYVADEMRIRVNHPDYVRMMEFKHHLRFPPTTSRPTTTQPFVYTVVLPPGAKVAGTVLDATTGEPVSGARLVAGEVFFDGMPMEWTRFDGVFELSGVRPGPFVLTVQHPEYAPEIVEGSVQAGWTARLSIQLKRGEPLAGVVVDEAGDPVHAARVMCMRWRGQQTVGLRVLTGDDGTFRFEHAPAGPLDFEFVAADGRARRWEILRAGKTDYRIVLNDVGPSPSLEDAAGPGNSGTLSVGKPAPDLAIKTLDGKNIELASLRGKYVFVDVWATWCPPCVAEMPSLKQLYAAVRDRDDFVMLGISLDRDAETVEAFVKKQGVGWPMVAGRDSGATEVAETLGAKFIPFNFLVGPDGNVLAVEIHGTRMPERITDLAPGKAPNK
ncbi:MAG: carboxypeptidase regulatory-like domain-containing protein [Phycisphaerae bacterium]|nr:carboxypeptidase regulatory-like domain-containing protein [Phycisphaerae bacterium]